MEKSEQEDAFYKYEELYDRYFDGDKYYGLTLSNIRNRSNVPEEDFPHQLKRVAVGSKDVAGEKYTQLLGVCKCTNL
jgi:hypothetical protein